MTIDTDPQNLIRKCDLVGGMEHSDLAAYSAAGQDVGGLAVQP